MHGNERRCARQADEQRHARDAAMTETIGARCTNRSSEEDGRAPVHRLSQPCEARQKRAAVCLGSPSNQAARSRYLLTYGSLNVLDYRRQASASSMALSIK